MPISDGNVESSCVCDNLEGYACDTLVGNDVKDGFGIGNAVVGFLEEDGDGRLWGPFHGHRLLIGIKHIGFDCAVSVTYMGGNVECGDLCIHKLWVMEIADINFVDSLD